MGKLEVDFVLIYLLLLVCIARLSTANNYIRSVWHRSSSTNKNPLLNYLVLFFCAYLITSYSLKVFRYYRALNLTVRSRSVFKK